MKKFELPLLQQRERKKNSRNKKEEEKITTEMILVSIGQLTVNFFVNILIRWIWLLQNERFSFETVMECSNVIFSYRKNIWYSQK